MKTTSANQKGENIFAPFSGQLAVDRNLQYIPTRTPSELKEYITTKVSKRKSKIDALNSAVGYPSPYHFASFAEKAYEDYNKKTTKEDEKGLTDGWPDEPPDDWSLFTTSKFAEKADEAYNEETTKEYEKGLPDEWELLTIANNPGMLNGYFGAAYWHPEREQIVIAHRGTEPTNLGADWTDISGVIFGRYVDQMNAASTFSHHILSVLETVNQEYGTNFKMDFTGHSLGGWLAQITTFTVKYLTVDATNSCFVKADQEGYHAHTVVFDSPGCKTMLAQMQDSFAVRYDKDHALPITTLDINSYLSAPNRINTCNAHVGKIYRIFVDLSDMTYLKSLFSYNTATHSIDKILKTFDPETGQVYKDESGRLKIQEVVDWPVDSYFGGEYKAFFKWAKHLNKYHPDPRSDEFQTELRRKKGYYPIRYQTKTFNERACSINVCSQSEQEVLKSYELLRKFPKLFNPDSLFNLISDDTVKEEVIQTLNSFTIKNDMISCDSAENKDKLIALVKWLGKFYSNIVDEIKRQVSVKGFKDQVYQHHSNQYLKDINSILNQLDFKNDDHAVKGILKNFLDSTDQQVWQVAIQEDTRLCLFRVYKILEQIAPEELALNHYCDKNNHTILKLSKLLTTNEIIGIQSLLESKTAPHLLMVECNPSDVNEPEVKKVFTSLFQKVKDGALKRSIKIILITKQDNSDKGLLFKTLINQNLDNQKYIATKDQGFTWNDLAPKSQEVLLDRSIQFQGKKTSIRELIQSNEMNQIFDFNTLVKLINNEKIAIGSKPLGISDSEGAYTELFEEINEDTLKTNLEHNASEVIYVISGINSEDQSNVHKVCIPNLTFAMDNSNDKIDMLTYSYVPVPGYKTIQLVDRAFQESNFKEVCHNHSDKKVYWIKWDGSKFILQQLYNPDFYIQRSFNRVDKVVIKKDVKESLIQVTGDQFVWSGKDDKELKIFLDLADHPLDNNRIFVIKATEDAKAIFNGLHGTVHWLEVITSESTEQIIWRGSKGSFSNLREHIDPDQCKISLEEQDSLLQSIKDQQVLIIADDPGMGKSTTLTKLYQSKYGLQNKSKLAESHWVININLRDHLQAIKTGIHSDCMDITNIAQFLSHIDSNLADRFSQNLLGFALCKKEGFLKPLLITFDGFDEIPDKEDRDKVIGLLKLLKNNTNTKIWITTRLHHRAMLKDTLSTFAITFHPIDDPTKRIFISKYLKDRLSLVLSNETLAEIFSNHDAVQEGTKIWEYSEALTQKIQSIFRGDGSRFIGAPLQLYLFLESNGAIKAFKNWATYPDDPPSFDYLGSNIRDVYETFINSKHDIYLKKAGITQEEIKESIKKQLNDYSKALAKLSIFSLAPQDDLEVYIKKYKGAALSSGIIKSEGSDLRFIHQTIEEYFATQTCMH
ncbi:MAG: hypothetical protein NMK33_05020 [Candidatus Cardinium sp.]|uniref:hypothetical protein n=1 Tax=Cardinium endosymbiont of Dermatophagoides farinae TaxID=2597823 RepID=UPI001181CFC1|nr:hypothetical protein [Cardinium endosymbiont of Dermatophagoides farinae]TSJ80779.1 hypothetical protein FPG78_01800 [Cardinium endosymbiont of Dermatophagoides farinae]UWW96783.1 MAG: hypothetical protein NMK33_05020 [Candidatus Cardinium sp.]